MDIYFVVTDRIQGRQLTGGLSKSTRGALMVGRRAARRVADGSFLQIFIGSRRVVLEHVTGKKTKRLFPTFPASRGNK